MRPGEAILLGGCAAAALVWVLAPASLPLWQGRAPGSAFLPFWIGAGTLLTILALLAARLRGRLRDAAAPAAVAAGRGRKPAVVAAMLLAAVALLEPLGFVTAMLLLVVVLVRLVERRSLAETGAVGAATVAIAILFREGLGVSLPAGPLGF